MKIMQLNLAAFGPFTDRSLTFDQENIGFHIVYGSNEAGKSSSLRGLKALLYGIDVRSTDNFIHANDKLLINGCLKNADGHELVFSRRKGNKNTLLDPDGNAIDDQSLMPFLQGVNPELFEMLFGIDHQALLKGGREILEQKGEVGQALFSASMGSHALHAVLEQFDIEANDLFKPTGSKPKINAALKEYGDLEKEIREHSLASTKWLEHDRALKKSVADLKKIEYELFENRAEINRLNRIQSLLPKLALRREQLRELVSLGEVVLLPENFVERRQQATKSLETARTIMKTATPRLQGLQNDLEDLIINQKLLDQEEAIEALYARLGSHRKNLQAQPELEAEHEKLLTEIKDLLKLVRPDLGWDEVETLRPLLLKRHSIAELGAQKALLIIRLQQAESGLQEKQNQLKLTRNEQRDLPESGSAKALRRTITAARKLGDIDAAIQSNASDIATSQSQCATDLSRLALWTGALDDFPGLPLPNRENINAFERSYEKRDKNIQQLEDDRKKVDDELTDTRLHLDAIERAGAVPTEEDLDSARTFRNTIWQLLRRQWDKGEDVSKETGQLEIEGELSDTFEARLTSTDELSDRLRREADRVHKAANYQARQAAMQIKIADLTRQLEAASEDKNQIANQWQALWAPCNIQPRTPREMRLWLDDAEKLRERVERLSSVRQNKSELEETRREHIKLLNEQMEAVGKPASKSEKLEMVLLECEESAQALDEVEQKRESLDKKIKDLELSLEALTELHAQAIDKHNAWNQQWQEAIKGFGRKQDAAPSEINEIVESLRELFLKHSEAEKLHLRIKTIIDESDSFCRHVTKMVESVSPELKDLSVKDAAAQLNKSLAENKSRLMQRKQIGAQIETASHEIRESEVSIQIMTEQLRALCQEAQCESPLELEEAERKSAQNIQINKTIEQLEEDIVATGKGATVSELEDEAGKVNPDTLPGLIEALSNKIDDELEPKRIAFAETKGREENELEKMNGSDEAALLAEEGQSILASVNADAENYVRVKLASLILRDQIERYRAENQGPLVERASECFAMLTRNSFAGLKTDFNEKDEPVLVGIRPSGDMVHVNGMSSGTRDQLYLALRLASLEKYMESSEPMPFIVDDILVDFDDDRSEAALIALSQLAEKTQVILFTHHSRVVEQARKIDRDIQIHNL